MKKSDFVRDIAKENEISIKQATKVVDSVFNRIAAGLSEEGVDGRFFVKGFGTFQVAERQPRKGRNPRTGDEIEIPRSVSIKFNTSKPLKERLLQA